MKKHNSLSNPNILKSQLAEVSAHYRTNPDVKRVQISSSEDVDEYVRQIYPVQIEHREAMVAIFLNRANNTVGYSTISVGGVSGTVADPKIIFQLALLTHASGLILVHNHPSGNLNPSQADIKLTDKIKSAGVLLDITLLDHLIITAEGYYSFADEGGL